MDCDSLGSAIFVVVDNLEEELIFRVAVGLEGSGFLVAVDIVVVVGFLARGADGGRLTSGRKRKIISLDAFTLSIKHFLNL